MRRPRRRFRPFRLIVWLLLLGGLAGVIGFAVLWFSTPLPPEQTEAQTTFIYDRNGERLAALFDGENRESVSLERVPSVLVDAVIAAEDKSFFAHSGVDPVGVGRALYQDVRRTGNLQGGSTITQQYVKNVYVGRERTLARKAREAVLAIKLERKFTKAQILERYLNTIYFGRGAYGVQAAAQAYFRIDVSKLDLAQSAYLAGLIRAPERADALRNPAVAARRRASVLQAMERTGAITSAERAEATTHALGAAPRRAPGAIYDQSDAGTEYFVDFVRRELIARYGADEVFSGGLRVTTTIDLALQRLAFAAVYTNTLDRASDPDGALVALDHDGRVVALVGGRDWQTSRVNLAVGRGGGGPGRPAGSTFKPFVLATALEEGYSAESQFVAPAKVSIGDWTVHNFNDREYGPLNLIDAMRVSANTVFAELMASEPIGPFRVVGTARAIGITSPMRPIDALALGVEDVSPMEMADSYLTFANRGRQTPPTLIAKVVAADGDVLADEVPEWRRVISARTADTMNEILQRVVNDGTGRNARLDVPVAGKTGTTNDNRDAWFVGYTPKDCCAVAVWVGYADGQRDMASVRGKPVNGGTLPAQIFSKFMEGAVAGRDVGVFRKVDRFRGKLLTGARLADRDRVQPTTVPATVPATTPSASDVDVDEAPNRVEANGAVTDVNGGQDRDGDGTDRLTPEGAAAVEIIDPDPG